MKPHNPPSPNQTPPREANFRMLLIDEINYISAVDKEGYRQQGILVYTADRLKECQRVLDQKKIDVICCHLNFNGGEGRHLLKKLYPLYQDRAYLWAAMVDEQSPLNSQDPLLDCVHLIFKPPIKRPYFIAKIRSALSQQARQHPRIESTNTVGGSLGTVKVATDDGYQQAHIKNLSTHGLHMSNLPHLKPGDHLDLILTLPSLKSPLSLKGQVVNRSAPPSSLTPVQEETSLGLGVSFTDVEPPQQKKLEQVLSHLLNKSPEKRYYGTGAG